MAETIPLEWWRQTPVARPVREGDEEPAGGRVAYWALVAFTIVLLVEPQQYFPFLSAIRINFLIALLAIAAHLVAGSRAEVLRFPLELRLATALVVWCALTIPGSVWPSGSLDVFIEFLKVVVVFWLLGQELGSLRRLRIMFWTLVLTMLPLTLTAVENYVSGVNVRGRIVGFGNNLAANPNDLALSLNLFLPLATALAISAGRRWMRLVAWGIAVLCVTGVILTFSRGGFLTLFVITVMVGRILMKRRSWSILVIGAIAAAALFILAPAGYGDRMGTILDIDADQTGSAQMRLGDTLASVGIMFDHPLLGAGLGMGVTALNEARGALWTNVHNAYLNYGVDTGVPGLLLFAAMVWASYRSARRIETSPDAQIPAEMRTLATGVRISLVAFALAAFFHPVGYDPYFFYLSGLAVALKATAVRQFGLTVRV